MLTCIPGLNTKVLMKDITNQVKSLSLKAVRRHRKKSQDSSKEADVGECSEGREEEWVAEPESGVLITLVSTANGCNRLKKIRFSEEQFDAFRAQKWWSENHDKVMELYSIHQENEQTTSAQIDEEFPIDPVEAHDNIHENQLPHEPVDTQHNTEKNIHNNAPSEEGSTTIAEKESLQNNIKEWIVEDEPGVFVTIRMLPDGSQEPLHVKFSRERFGEVKARVWWEENKARLQKQYS